MTRARTSTTVSAGRWASLTEDDRDKWTNWVASTCRQFGASRHTAHSVAAQFAAALDAEGRPVGPRSGER